MLTEKNSIRYDDFESEFVQRFTSFSQKAPILISFKTNPTGVTIYQDKSWEDRKNSKVVLEHSFNFTKPVKENIKEIKDFLLENVYPVLIEEMVVYDDYSAEELNSMLSSGDITIDEMDSQKRKTVTHTSWRIEKIIAVRDEIFMKNISTGKTYRYKMKMPVTIFLKQIREGGDKKELFDLFTKKSVLMNEIYENYSPHRRDNEE